MFPGTREGRHGRSVYVKEPQTLTIMSTRDEKIVSMPDVTARFEGCDRKRFLSNENTGTRTDKEKAETCRMEVHPEDLRLNCNAISSVRCENRILGTRTVDGGAHTRVIPRRSGVCAFSCPDTDFAR